MRRHHALDGQGHGKEHDGDAGMRRPGHSRSDDHIDDGLRRDRAHNQAQARHVLVGCQQRKKLLQGEKHQSEPDRDAAEIPRPASKAAAEQDDADQHKERCDTADVEREQLHDQRRADIGSEHDRQCGDQTDQPAGREA
jgi:hypothetical protein